MRFENIWNDINHVLNLVKISDKAVDTLDHFLLCLALLMVGAESLKMFWLILVIQESFKGDSGYVSFIGNVQPEVHFLRFTFYVVDCIHNSLLIFTIDD